MHSSFAEYPSSHGLARVLLCLLLFGCSGTATGPTVSGLAGAYVLEQVDGVSLPTPLLPSAVTDPCPPAITDGELDVYPANSEDPAGYGLGIFAGHACDAEGIPSLATVIVRDGGRFSVSGDRVLFNSFGRTGFTQYQTTVQGGSQRPTLTIPLGSHTYTFQRVAGPRYPTGMLELFVVDQQGSRVSGTFLVVHGSNGLVTRVGTSDLAPPLLVGPAAGPVVINVAPPPGFTFAPSQPNPVRVSATAGQTTQVTVVLAKTSP
ncbi:MAG: hypothetical protein ACR2M1_17690 [Gemmatimonadaceae bacterium]